MSQFLTIWSTLTLQMDLNYLFNLLLQSKPGTVTFECAEGLQAWQPTLSYSHLLSTININYLFYLLLQSKPGTVTFECAEGLQAWQPTLSYSPPARVVNYTCYGDDKFYFVNNIVATNLYGCTNGQNFM